MSKNLKSADGSERAVKGYKPSSKDQKLGAKVFNKANSSIKNLPAKVDLRYLMTPVENQHQTSSCTANATAGAYEYLLKRNNGSIQDVSRLYIYYNGRYVADSDNIEDEGLAISNAIAGLKEYGACSEDTWAFDPDLVNDEPDQGAYDEGAIFQIKGTRRVPVDLEAWKFAIASAHPIIFGLALYDSFDKQRKPGLVPAPTQTEVTRASHAGHAMLCVGYSDPDQVFIVRNSWGDQWGDKGYCYIPYQYMMSPDQNFGDSWIIDAVEELPPDEESWSDDDESVLEEVSSVLAEMDEDAYQELLEGMGDHPFERRLALLFLAAASADGEISDDEIDVITEFLEPVLEQIGGNQNANGILKYAKRYLKDKALIDESIDLIWEYFDYDVLASMTNQIQEASEADGLAKAERKFIDELTARWQAGADDDDDEDDDDDDDDEDDDDDDEDDDEDDEDDDEDDEDEDDEDDEDDDDEDDEDDDEDDEDDDEDDEDDDEDDEDDDDDDEDDEDDYE